MVCGPRHGWETLFIRESRAEWIWRLYNGRRGSMIHDGLRSRKSLQEVHLPRWPKTFPQTSTTCLDKKNIDEPMNLLHGRVQDGKSDMARIPQINAGVESPWINSNDTLDRAAKSADYGDVSPIGFGVKNMCMTTGDDREVLQFSRVV